MDDADEAYSLRPPALTDPEHDTESKVGPDENNDPLVITLGKERSKVLEVSERPPEKEGRSASNRTRLNTFQPLGRNLPRDKAYLSTSNSKETIAGDANKNQIMKAERECTSDPCVKKGTEFHKMILPEVTNSEDEIMTASKVDQEHIAERIDHWSCKTDDISEKVSLNIPQSSDLLVHKGTRKKIITKDDDTYPCKEREEITDADSLATLELAVNEAQWEKNVPEEADAYPCEERKGAIDNNNPAGSNLIGHLDPWRRNVTEEADVYLGDERK